MKDARTCYSGVQTCCRRSILGEEDHVQKESIHLWTKGSPLISHTHTSSGLSGVWITEGRGGEESSPVREEEAGERAARMVRAGWGGGEVERGGEGQCPEWPGRARSFPRAPPCGEGGEHLSLLASGYFALTC